MVFVHTSVLKMIKPLNMFLVFYLQVYASDCDLIVSLATGLGFSEFTSRKLSSLVNDCCAAGNGITCVNETVTRIDWAGMGLSGTINATAIPSQISYFAMAHNQITGNFPLLPDTVNYVYMFVNKLNGTLPRPPASVFDYRVWLNDLNGDIPTFLGYNLFHAHYNRISGSIPSLDGIYQFSMSNNLLTGSIPPLRHMRSFYVEGNLLSGNVPTLPPFLEHFHLGSLGANTNNIYGELVIDKPVLLYLVNNSFTNITIKDTSALSDCDISYNPLPYSVVQLYPMCLQVGTGSNYSVVRQQTSTVMDTSAYNTGYSTTEYTTSETYTDTAYEWMITNYKNATTKVLIHTSSQKSIQSPIVLKTRNIAKASTAVSISTSTPTLTNYSNDDQTTTEQSETTTTLPSVYLFVDTSPTIRFMIQKDIFSIGKIVLDLVLVLNMLVIFSLRKNFNSHKRTYYSSNQ